MKRNLLLLIFLLFYYSSFSQPSDCKEIITRLLPDGAYDFETTHLDEYMYSSVISWYKMHQDDTYAESKKRSADLTVPIDDVLVGLKLTQSDSSYNRFIKNIETYSSNYSEYEKNLKTSWKKVNTEAIDKFKACFIEQRGLRLVKILTPDPDQFIVRFYYNNDYRGGPQEATVSLSQVSKNIYPVEAAVKSLRIKHKSHADILVKRTNNKSATIVFSTPAKVVDDSPLSFSFDDEIPSKVAASKIQIVDGKLQENVTLHAEWGNVEDNTQLGFVTQYRSLPIQTSHYYEAAHVNTTANDYVMPSQQDLFSWQLKIRNDVGGKSGGNGLGGYGNVRPNYRATLVLPPAEGGQTAFYALRLKGETFCNDKTGVIDEKSKVTLSSARIDTSFEFAVETEHKGKVLLLDSLRSGSYLLTLQMPSIRQGSKGKHMHAPDAFRAVVYETDLTAFIEPLALPEQATKPIAEEEDHQVIVDPKKQDSNNTIYYILGAVVLAAIGGYFYFTSRK